MLQVHGTGLVLHPVQGPDLLEGGVHGLHRCLVLPAQPLAGLPDGLHQVLLHDVEFGGHWLADTGVGQLQVLAEGGQGALPLVPQLGGENLIQGDFFYWSSLNQAMFKSL